LATDRCVAEATTMGGLAREFHRSQVLLIA